LTNLFNIIILIMFSAMKESSTGYLLIILLAFAHLMLFSLVLRRWDERFWKAVSYYNIQSPMHIINYTCLKRCNFILNGALVMMSEHPSYYGRFHFVLRWQDLFQESQRMKGL